ncbi:MAG: phage/plasmid primase, P4 family [Bacteroidota bacterium]|nr:phage/plasmid primase, P4 family [Bacteroidota bacterium]
MKNSNLSEKVRKLFFSLPPEKSIFDFFYQDKGQIRFDDSKFRGAMIVNKNNIRRMNGDYLLFMGGRWKQVNEENMMKIVKREITKSQPDLQYTDTQFKKIIDNIDAQIEDFPTNSELYKIQTTSFHKVITEDFVYKINYNYETQKIDIESEENIGQFYNFVSIPGGIDMTSFNKDNYETKVDEIDEFLKDLTRSDTTMIKYLQEVVGYSMLFGHLEPYIYIGLGKGSNGKSVFATMARTILGSANVTTLEYADINPQTSAKLESHFLNLPTELSGSKLLPENLLKAIVDGEYIHANEKYMQPRDIKPLAKQFAMANELPAIKDASDGFWRRAVVIPFDMQVKNTSSKKKDKSYFQTLFINNEDLLKEWGFEGLVRLIEQKGVHTFCERIVEASKKYQLDNNNALMFLNFIIEEKVVPYFSKDEVYPRHSLKVLVENYARQREISLEYNINGNGEHSIKINDLFNVYKTWCENDGYKSLSIKNFKKKLDEKAGTQYFDFDFEIRKSSNQDKIFFSEPDLQTIYYQQQKSKQLELDFEAETEANTPEEFLQKEIEIAEEDIPF